jgi:hypothetical protein
VIVYSKDAGADRDFLRDVLRLRSVDAGGGWLIFALPPAEIAFHPGDENDVHELYLMCTDLRVTRKELQSRGIRSDEPKTERWGIRTAIRLPGGGSLGLYQPTHPTAVRLARRPRISAAVAGRASNRQRGSRPRRK